jgi:hypothetical protein
MLKRLGAICAFVCSLLPFTASIAQAGQLSLAEEGWSVRVVETLCGTNQEFTIAPYKSACFSMSVYYRNANTPTTFGNFARAVAAAYHLPLRSAAWQPAVWYGWGSPTYSQQQGAKGCTQIGNKSLSYTQRTYDCNALAGPIEGASVGQFQNDNTSWQFQLSPPPVPDLSTLFYAVWIYLPDGQTPILVSNAGPILAQVQAILMLQAETTVSEQPLQNGERVAPGTMVTLTGCVTSPGRTCKNPLPIDNFLGKYLYVCGRWESGPQHNAGWQPLYQGIAAGGVLGGLYQNFSPPGYSVDTVDYFIFASRSRNYGFGSPCPVSASQTETGLPQAVEFTLSWGQQPPTQPCAGGCSPAPSGSPPPPPPEQHLAIPPPQAKTLYGVVNISASPDDGQFWPQPGQRVDVTAWAPGAPPGSTTTITYQVVSPTAWQLASSGGPGVIAPPTAGSAASGWVQGTWVTVVVEAQVQSWHWVYYRISPRRWSRLWEPYIYGVSSPLVIHWSAWFPT